MAGSMDAFYLKNNVCNILDYKITLSAEAPKDLYFSQMEFYAYAAYKLTGCENVKTKIIFLREGFYNEKNFNINININSIDEAGEKILNYAKLSGSKNFKANLNNCKNCPFKKGCFKYAG